MERRTVPAVLESLGELRRLAGEAAQRAGIDPAKSYTLQLAIDEIATNMILYGYKETGGSSVIVISNEIRDDRLVVRLEDEAPAFDPRTMEQPEAADLARPLDERTMGGLGIFLAVRGVDRFDYRHENGRNINVFEVLIPHG